VEDGVLQKITFFNAEDEPVSLGILLDVSGSMAATGKLDHAKDALSRVLGTMRPDDEMFYLRFHRQVDKIVDFTSDPHRILSAISETGATQDGTQLVRRGREGALLHAQRPPSQTRVAGGDRWRGPEQPSRPGGINSRCSGVGGSSFHYWVLQQGRV
jgi:hypothetical protein